jgi:hypothetical protein
MTRANGGALLRCGSGGGLAEATGEAATITHPRIHKQIVRAARHGTLTIAQLQGPSFTDTLPETTDRGEIGAGGQTMQQHERIVINAPLDGAFD